MITVPPNLRPSELLFLEGVPDFVTDLLQASRSLRAEARWQEAEQSARSAFDGSQEMGAQISRGAALIHLGDVHLAMARTGLALQDAGGAYRLFAAQPSRYQRHNEAIAAYALGLVHQSLGDPVEALGWYERAVDLLDKVKLDWSATNARSRMRCCIRAEQWIEALIECLTDVQAALSTASHSSLWLPVAIPDSEARFSLARIEVERYIVGGTLELAGQTYEIERLDGPGQPSLPSKADCYAMRVPRRALQLLDADEGDYAVIVRQSDADREGPGVLETLSGVEFGDFTRDAAGRINFVRPDATVIGGESIGEDFPVGYIAALIRRA